MNVSVRLFSRQEPSLLYYDKTPHCLSLQGFSRGIFDLYCQRNILSLLPSEGTYQCLPITYHISNTICQGQNRYAMLYFLDDIGTSGEYISLHCSLVPLQHLFLQG